MGAKSPPLNTRRKHSVPPICLIASSADLPLTPANRLSPNPNNSRPFLLDIATLLWYNTPVAGWTRSPCRVGGKIPSSRLFDNFIPHRLSPNRPLICPAVAMRRFRSLWGRFGVALGSLWGRFGVALGSLWGRFGVALGSLFSPGLAPKATETPIPAHLTLLPPSAELFPPSHCRILSSKHFPSPHPFRAALDPV